MIQVYGTSLAWEGKAFLLRGPSGAGKSDLALRLIEEGACLIADDQTRLAARRGRLLASAPPAIAGLLEIRGFGIVKVPFAEPSPLVLAVDLVAPAAVERLPEVAHCTYLGVRVPRMLLCPFEVSATAKLRRAAAALAAGELAA